MRKPISKKVRELVYAKYDGHCAYCGCELEMKNMQVDHLRSVYNHAYHNEATDNSIDNLMPSCRQCNFYKGGNDLETFRQTLANKLSHTCVDSFQAKLAIKYGMIEVKKWDNKFYFEKV